MPAPGPQVASIPNGHLWLMAIVPDLTAIQPNEGAIRADALIQQDLAAHQNHLRWIDQSAPTDYAPWLQAARTKGSRVVCVVDDRDPAGTLKDSLTLDANTITADVAALLKRWQFH